MEGWITRDILYMHYQNTIAGRCDGKQDLCDKISDWVKVNDKWVGKQLHRNRYIDEFRTFFKENVFCRRSDPYWHQVGLFYDQISGLYKVRIESL